MAQVHSPLIALRNRRDYDWGCLVLRNQFLAERFRVLLFDTLGVLEAWFEYLSVRDSFAQNLGAFELLLAPDDRYASDVNVCIHWQAFVRADAAVFLVRDRFIHQLDIVLTVVGSPRICRVDQHGGSAFVQVLP